MSILQSTIEKYEIKLLMHEGQGVRVYQASMTEGITTTNSKSDYVVIKQVIHDNNTLAEANQNIQHQIDVLQALKAAGYESGFVTLLAHGHDEQNCAYFVMPKYEHTLTRFLQLPDIHISATQLLDWLSELTKHLNNLHVVGFTHNDLKPDNLFVTDRNTLIIGDFGASQPYVYSLNESDASKKQHAKLKLNGTPAFASPELLYATRPVCGASDFYSIGKVAQYIVNALNIDIPTQFHEFILRLAQEDIGKRLSNYSAIEKNIEGLRHSLDDNRTQVLSDNWLVEKYSSLYEKILLLLSQNGQISEADEAFLQRSYLANMQTEQSFTVLSSIQQCAFDALCKDQNMRDWLMWCQTLNKQLEHRANRLSKSEFLAMTDDGIRLSKRNRYQVESYIKKRAKIIGTSRKRYWALSFLLCLLVLCGLYFYEIKPNMHADNTKVVDDASDHIPNNDASESLVRKPLLTIENQDIVEGGIEIEMESNTEKKSTSAKADNKLRRLRLALNSDEAIFIDFVKVQGRDGSVIWVMQNEVPIVLYNACVDAGECRKVKRFTTHSRANDNFDNMPATNISWFDITEDFIPYLNQVFSARFRLPSLAEWNTLSERTSSVISVNRVNTHCKNCNSQFSRRFNNGPIPTDLMTVDGKNLRNIYGNVQEWLDECPRNKQNEPVCYQAIVAGGSWMHTVDDILHDSIDSLQKRARSINTGFRLVESEE